MDRILYMKDITIKPAHKMLNRSNDRINRDYTETTQKVHNITSEYMQKTITQRFEGCPYGEQELAFVYTQSTSEIVVEAYIILCMCTCKGIFFNSNFYVNNPLYAVPVAEKGSIDVIFHTEIQRIIQFPKKYANINMGLRDDVSCPDIYEQ